MTPSKILVWGGDSWANRGDAAVLAGTLTMLRDAWPTAQITVASDRPDETERHFVVPAVRRRSLGFVRALLSADLVLWGGGQMIQNASSKPFLFLQLAFLVAALLLGKRVVCFAQGVGPVSGSVSRLLACLVLNRLHLITVRDTASRRRLEELGVTAKLHVTADPSFCLTPTDATEVDAVMQDIGLRRPFLAVALRRWGHYQGGWLPVRLSRRKFDASHQQWFAGFCSDVAGVLDEFRSKTGLDVLFIPMCPGGDQEDDVVAQAVIANMTKRGVFLLEQGVSPVVLKGLLGRADLVLAMRTHAGMLAAAAGAPVAFLSYQGKGEGFLEEIGLSEYALDIDSFSREVLDNLLARTWRDRETVRATLAVRLPVLRERARHNIDLIEEQTRYPVLDAGRWARLTSGQPRRSDAILPSRLSGLLEQRREAVLQLARPAKNELVLDIGCGVGHYARPTETAGAAWVGIDASLEMLDYARDAALDGVRVIRGDAVILPFKNKTLDLCLCIGLLDYIEPDAVSKILQEMRRVLKPGGRMVLSCNASWRGEGLKSALPVFGGDSPKRNDHTEEIPLLLQTQGLDQVESRFLKGGLLGSGTLIFLAYKTPACGSAATTVPSSRLASA